MGGFTRIVGIDPDTGLDVVGHRYLVGQRGAPDGPRSLEDDRLDLEILHHQDHGAQAARSLADATEYHYVLSGWTQYLDVDSGREHDVITGELCAIARGTTFAQKWKPGTRIVVIRVPSADGGSAVEEPSEVLRWRERRLKTTRTDHWHAADAPPANSVRPAVAVAVMSPRGQLLLLRRSDSGNWTMPGGTVEHHDSLVTCARREVREESGLDVEVTDVIGTYSDPEVRVAYSDGEVRREFTVLLAAEPVVGDVTIDEESTDFTWHHPDDVSTLPMAASQRRRVEDVVRYLRTGRRSLQ